MSVKLDEVRKSHSQDLENSGFKIGTYLLWNYIKIVSGNKLKQIFFQIVCSYKIFLLINFKIIQ